MGECHQNHSQLSCFSLELETLLLTIGKHESTTVLQKKWKKKTDYFYFMSTQKLSNKFWNFSDKAIPNF